MGRFVREQDAHCAFLWVHASAPDERLSRAWDVLESVIVHGQKVTALNHGVATSTIAAQCVFALEQLGVVEPKVSRVPLLIALPIVAAQFSLSISGEIQAWPGHSVLRVTGADAGLKMLLPEAQYAVASALLDGLGYEEIAKRRGVSSRTVANQVAGIFGTLKVSSRAGLVWVVARALAKGPSSQSEQTTSQFGADSIRDAMSEVASLRLRVERLERELAAIKAQLKE
jgi:DNA-binding CsgD family transcriptional regulator